MMRTAGGSLKSYSLRNEGEALLTGLAIGGAAASGPVCLIESAGDIADFVTPTIRDDVIARVDRMGRMGDY